MANDERFPGQGVIKQMKASTNTHAATKFLGVKWCCRAAAGGFWKSNCFFDCLLRQYRGAVLPCRNVTPVKCLILIDKLEIMHIFWKKESLVSFSLSYYT